MTKLVDEADILKSSETISVVIDPRRGAKPVRKRAYHRALKRGYSWALLKKCIDADLNNMNKAIYALYEGVVEELIFKDHPLVGLLPK